MHFVTGTETYGGGPQSYICRLSGPSDGNWTFWLEVKFDSVLTSLYYNSVTYYFVWWCQANSSEALRVDVAVLDQKLVEPMKRLKDLFPDWVDVTAYSTFMSSYIL